MNGNFLRAAVAVVVTSGVGCVQHDLRGYDTAIRSAADHPNKPAARSQVHLFILNGLDPTEDTAMFRLRDELTRAGFPMIHYAQRDDADFYYREMHRIVHDQPPARLLLVGYGSAAGKVQELACKVLSEGLPLDGLVLLDPAGGQTEYVVDDRLPVLVVRSHHWPLGRRVASGNVTELPGVGHQSLPDHPQTVSLLAGMMADSAARVQLEPPDGLPHLVLNEHPQPTPRPNLTVVVEPIDQEIRKK